MPDYFPESKEYNVIIQNDEEEQQFTNLLELVAVNHDATTQVGMDKMGNVYAIENPQKPTNAIDNSGNDVHTSVAFEDDVSHAFDNSSEDNYNSLYLSYAKPKDVSNAKLVLRIKNNKWAGFVYNEFSAMFGKYYDNWVKKNHNKTYEFVDQYEGMNGKYLGIGIVEISKDDNIFPMFKSHYHERFDW